MLQGSSYAFHGVHINPCDSRLLVTGKKKSPKSIGLIHSKQKAKYWLFSFTKILLHENKSNTYNYSFFLSEKTRTIS